jgi:hypothetical protein
MMRPVLRRRAEPAPRWRPEPVGPGALRLALRRTGGNALAVQPAAMPAGMDAAWTTGATDGSRRGGGPRG